MKPTKLEVLDAMERHGGGFFSALAVAWRKADLQNEDKLFEAFREYYLFYERGVELDRERKEHAQ